MNEWNRLKSYKFGGRSSFSCQYNMGQTKGTGTPVVQRCHYKKILLNFQWDYTV